MTDAELEAAKKAITCLRLGMGIYRIELDDHILTVIARTALQAAEDVRATQQKG